MICRATVLYDRSFPSFQPISLAKKHELFVKLSEQYTEFKANETDNIVPDVVESTAFTNKLANGTVVYKSNRPGIIVSSTSWTPDEDFGILLKALER